MPAEVAGSDTRTGQSGSRNAGQLTLAFRFYNCFFCGCASNWECLYKVIVCLGTASSKESGLFTFCSLFDIQIQNTHEIKRRLLNRTEWDKMCKFSRKSSFSSYKQHNQKNKQSV